MLQKFHKYVGAGNDFVMLDFITRDKMYLNIDFIKKICHRRFGIGADGLITIEESKTSDFLMRYYNSDGKEGTMCGNGGRCAVQFAADLGIIDSQTTFEAVDGKHKAHLTKDLVNLQMNDVQNIETTPFGEFANTGSPHVMVKTENTSEIDAYAKGKEIRYNSYFGPSGVNVNFYEIKNDEIHLKTYERGVENVTWACGTGSVATAITAHFKGLIKHSKNIKVISKGGTLYVSFDYNKNFNNIWLEGDAKRVFSGYDFVK